MFTLKGDSLRQFTLISYHRINKKESPMRTTFPVISEALPPDPLPPAGVVAAAADEETAQNPKKENVMGA